MAVNRAKAQAIDVPQSDDAANALLFEYGELQIEIAKIDAALDSDVQTMKACAETGAKPLQERCKTIFTQLQAFGAAHRDRLTDKGKSKTVPMPAGAIGWRNDPPSVKFAKGLKVDAIVANIVAAGMKRFLRIKQEPNKERMLEEPQNAALIEGVTILTGVEKFFIEPVGLDLSEPKG